MKLHAPLFLISQAGEEIYVSYGDSYWNVHEQNMNPKK